MAAGGSITSFSHPDLIAAYTMDNISGSTLVDESPNGNDGAITGATQVAGHIGNALDFDGASDYVNATAYPGTAINNFGCGIWVRADVVSQFGICFGHRMATDGSGSTNNSGAFIRVDDSRGTLKAAGGYVYVNDESTTDSNGNTTTNYISIIWSDVDLSTADYHFVWLNVAGNSAELFVDGASAGTISSTQTINYAPAGASNGECLAAQKAPDGSFLASFLDGKLDQFRFFGRTLTAAEISDLYNGGAGA